MSVAANGLSEINSPSSSVSRQEFDALSRRMDALSQRAEALESLVQRLTAPSSHPSPKNPGVGTNEEGGGGDGGGGGGSGGGEGASIRPKTIF